MTIVWWKQFDDVPCDDKFVVLKKNAVFADNQQKIAIFTLPCPSCESFPLLEVHFEPIQLIGGVNNSGVVRMKYFFFCSRQIDDF